MATRTTVEKAQLVVSRPEKGDTNTYVIKPGMTVAVAGFTFSDGVATIRGEDLVIQFPDGSQIVLQDFVEVAQYNNPPVLVFEDGTVLPGSDVLLQVAALDGAPVDVAALDAKLAAIEPAAGPAGGAAPSNLVSGGLGSASNFAIGSIGGDGVAVSARPDNVDFGRATEGGIQVGGPTGDGNGGGNPPNGGNSAPNAFNATLVVDDDAPATAINIPAPTDANGDPLTITITSLPNIGTLLLNGVPVTVGQTLTVAQLQALTFDPNDGQLGNTSFTYTVSDGQATDTGIVNIVVNDNGGGNQAPNAFDATLVVDDDAAATALNIPAPTDADGDTLTVTINSLPTLGVLMLNGVAVVAGQVLTVAELQALTFDPANGQFGDTSFTYTVNDGNGGSDVGTVNINVQEQDPANQAPNAFDATLVVDDDAAATALNIPAPTDADGDTLTVTINSLPTLGVLMLNGVAVVAGQVLTVAELQALTFDPANGQFGDTSFTYTVSDGQATDTGTVNITVNEQDPANQAPNAFDATVVMNEDAGATALNIPSPTDADGDALTVTINGLPALGTLTLNGVAVTVGQVLTVGQLQSLQFTPNANANGNTSFTYTVNDGQATDTATVNIIVNPVNDNPNAEPNGFPAVLTVDDDAGATPINIQAPTDVDGDTLSITINSLPNGVLGSLLLNGVPVTVGQVLTVAQLQALTFDPNNGQFGTTTFNYTVSDGNGGFDTATVTLNVVEQNANNAPNAFDATLVVDDDAAATALNIPAPTDADGDTLTVTINSLPTLGVLMLNGVAVVAGQVLTVAQLQALTFDPANGQFGNTSFTYTVNDGNGGTDTATVNIVVNEQNANQAPNAFDATLVVDDDAAATALNIPAPADADGDTLTVTINSLPTLGVLMLNGLAVVAGQVLTVAQLQALTFDPANGQFGSTSFTYTVNDGQASDTATVNITVNEQDVSPVNNAPVALDQTVVMDEDAGNVALNILRPTDADGDALTVRIDSLPGLGTLTLNGVAVHVGQILTVAQLQTLSFTTALDANGTTSFHYTVTDTHGASDGATVNIVVNPMPDLPPNHAPIALDQTVVMDEDSGTVLLNVLRPFDQDGDALSITIDSLPHSSLGSLVLNGVAVQVGQVLTVAQLQSLSFTTAPDANGTSSFHYTVSDSHGASDGATVNIVVNPVMNIATPIAPEHLEYTPLPMLEEKALVAASDDTRPEVGPMQQLLSEVHEITLPPVAITAWEFDEAHVEIDLSDKALGIEVLPVDNSAYAGGEFVAQNDQVPVVGLWDTLPVEPVQQYHVM